MNTRLLGAIAGTAALLAVGAHVGVAHAATGSFEQSLSVDEPVELEVRSGAGDISVRSGAAGRVHVVGRIRVHDRFGRSDDEAEEIVRELEADPPVEVLGNRVRVGLEHDGGWQYERGISISYEIEVPEQSSVTSRTGSGSQQLSGLAGPVSAATGSGRLDVTDVGGPVELGTGSGGIRAERIAGAITARAGSGSIRLSQTAPGDVEVRTGSGSSDLSGIDGALHARAGSGRITVQGRPSGTWDIGSGSGSVRIDVPDDVGFELEAHTGSGEIYTAHPITLEGGIRRGHLRGEIGGGGALMQLRTGSGDIRIE